MKLGILFPIHFSGVRISYTCYSIAENMKSSDFDVKITTISTNEGFDNSLVQPILPSVVGRGIRKLWPSRAVRIAEEVFLNRMNRSDPAYIWSDFSLKFMSKAKDRGILLFAEKFNGLAAPARELLDAAYHRAKLQPTHGLSAEMIDKDFERINLSDYIFVSNPIAAKNMVKYGISESKIINTSYGWDENNFHPVSRHKEKGEDVVFLFVGVAAIRKGANLLLEAWQRAQIKGKLVFAGPVLKEVEQICSDILNRDDVEVLGWIENTEEAYRNADVFVFPTHDEGGPLVTFEAMGSGLPVIVSPMGATTVARHDVDGFVIDPYDIDAWVDAMRKLANEADLREEMGKRAYEQAKKFTWKKIGEQRRRQIQERTGNLQADKQKAL